MRLMIKVTARSPDGMFGLQDMVLAALMTLQQSLYLQTGWLRIITRR